VDGGDIQSTMAEAMIRGRVFRGPEGPRFHRNCVFGCQGTMRRSPGAAGTHARPTAGRKMAPTHA